MKIVIREIPFGTAVAGKRQAVFVAFVTWSMIYESYDDPSMTSEYRASSFPMVLMMFRWDGSIGFVGGFLEEGRSIHEQAVEEVREEIGISVLREELIDFISHETDDMVVHLFRYELPAMLMKNMLSLAAKAQHSISEGTAVWAHLADYSRGAGWQRVLG